METQVTQEELAALQAAANVELPATEAVEMIVNQDYKTLFGVWTVKGKDLIVQLYPRNGLEDEWSYGGYSQTCKDCGTESDPSLQCPKCKSWAREYIPGRGEVPGKTSFPASFSQVLEDAVNGSWYGDAAVSSVPELGAYVVKFEEAHSTGIDGMSKIVDKLLLGIASRL